MAGERRTTALPGGIDRLYRAGLRTAGVIVLAIMATVGLFLLDRGFSALAVAKWRFLSTQNWQPDSHNFGIAAVLPGTLLIAGVAIVVAVPLAIGMALFISEYLTGWWQRTLTSAVDLMAAVPSVVFGLWGFHFLQGDIGITDLSAWLARYLGWIPLFAVTGADPDDPLASRTVYTSSTFIAGIVVGLMVMPIICAVMREAFSQAPAGEREGAYALGATRWGMIGAVVLPFGRGGMIGGTMLGLGRAMGETIAVYMIVAAVYRFQPHILQNGANSVSAMIALQYGSASQFGLSALMAAGLVLFLLTLVVNFAASAVIARSRSGQMSEG
ncbi:phosphate ABC transporter permease subunit PstC [Pseudonocardiaceae bacterium YIM PH 21723]|nr:phosphate ABC transporter permease subunit PstC [Pseudonocardiaceae bacterium YIM PH 21723]